MKSKRGKKTKNNGTAILNEEEKEMYACRVWGLQTRLGTNNQPSKTRKMMNSNVMKRN
jgi:hypothetical protein